MRVPVSVRIFLVQLLFTIGAAAAAVLMVQSAFQRYAERWERSVATFPAEQLFQPVASEVARSLLLRLDEPPEVRERDQEIITRGLNALLKGLPSLSYVIVTDRDHRIQYSNMPAMVDLAYVRDEYVSFLASEAPARRQRSFGSDQVTEAMIPVYDEGQAGAERTRLGSVIVAYGPDPGLLARLPAVRPPSIPPGEFLWPLTVLLAAVVTGSLIVAGLLGLPVRRLDRALGEFRERGYEGVFDPGSVPRGSGLASTVSAISELGGRVAALDALAREREALLATLTHALEDGIIALDPSGRPLAWNRAALRMLGSELAGDGTDGREAEDERLREALSLHVALIAGSEEQDGPVERDAELPGPDGETLVVHVLQVPFQVRPGQKGRLVLLRDLTTVRKIETHLLEAGRYSVLAHLAGSLAHEIRNPLHSIGVNAEVIEQHLRGRARRDASFLAMTESLSAIQEETRRLRDLLNNYLGLMRSAPTPEPVDVRDLCRKVLQLLGYTAIQSKVELTLEGEEDLPPVHGLPDRLQQAILNLAVNAIQAMPEGGVLRVRTAVSGGMVQVAVADTGPGLPPELAERPFETRITTKSGGTGLGLPLVRMIVESHGGSVWYRTRTGEGTTFTLVLPAQGVPLA